MGEKVEEVAKNTVQHGEGPHWDDVTECVYYVDTMKDNIHKYDSNTGESSWKSLGDTMCSIVIPRKKGGFVVTTRTEVGVVDTWSSGQVQPICSLVKEPMMLNDGKVDSSGRLWVGSNYYGDQSPPSTWPQGQGHLYSVDPDHSVNQHFGNITIANGIAWTADNRTMFYIDSLPGHMMAFDFDLDAGKLSNKRTVTSFGSKENPDVKFPDGMTIDADDKLWVAGYDDGKIIRIDPETGKVIRTINFPVRRVTSCCFGGKDFSDLYGTTSTFHMTPEMIQNNPLAGSLFKVSGLGVKGRQANVFAG